MNDRLWAVDPSARWRLFGAVVLGILAGIAWFAVLVLLAVVVDSSSVHGAELTAVAGVLAGHGRPRGARRPVHRRRSGWPSAPPPASRSGCVLARRALLVARSATRPGRTRRRAGAPHRRGRRASRRIRRALPAGPRVGGRDAGGCCAAHRRDRPADAAGPVVHGPAARARCSR